MSKWLVRGGAVVAVSVMLGSCESMVLPDYNGGMLNPDIRFLKAGEVMNGVKCDMTEFMREREEDVVAERVETVIRRRENDETAKRFLLLYGSEYRDYSNTKANIYLGRIRAGVERHEGTDNELNPYATNLDSLQSHLREIDSSDVDPRGGGKLAGLCWPHETGRYKGMFRHWDVVKRKCVLNAPDKDAPPEEVGSGESCPQQIGLTIWNYDPHPNKGVATSHCTAVPDYSRFALDRTQQATLQLTLLATNQGTVFFDFIDQSRLGVLKQIVTPGNRVAGAVFPKVDITAKGSTTFDMSVLMPQTIFEAPGPSSPYEIPAAKSAGAMRNNWNSISQGAAHSRQPRSPSPDRAGQLKSGAQGETSVTLGAGGYLKLPEQWKEQVEKHPEVIMKHENGDYKFSLDADAKLIPSDKNAKIALDQALRQLKERDATLRADGTLIFKKKAPSLKPVPDVLTNKEIDLVANELTPYKQFAAGCGSNGLMKVDATTEIDYLKLKEVLHNVVARQNEQVSYNGGPEVALDTLNLTSSFEIVLDISAGTSIFRLFPVVLPPQIGVKPDHTHTLKIALHGAKKKGDAQSGQHLVAACQQRLQLKQGEGGICERAEVRLLEAMIEANEQSKSSNGGQ